MSKPLLLLDVDGVLAPFGDPNEFSMRVYKAFYAGEYMIPLYRRYDAPELLQRLAEVFELAWATMWQEHANQWLLKEYELPELPVVKFAPPAWPASDTTDQTKIKEFFSANPMAAKLPYIASYIGDRPAAWIDDHILDADLMFAEWRNETGRPTLFLRTDPAAGMNPENVEELLAFAASVQTTLS